MLVEISSDVFNSKFSAFIISFSVSSQESLEALGTNPKLNRENPISANRTIDKNYVYAIDTLKLPFKDDFSGDLFKKFNAQPNDANVSDTLFHSILNGGIPDIDTAAYMFDTTYHYVLTPVAPFPDSFLIDTFPVDTPKLVDENEEIPLTDVEES